MLFWRENSITFEISPKNFTNKKISPLQQLIVASPLALQGGAASLAPLASTTSKRDKDRGSKSRKRKSREEHQLYMDPKGNI